MYRELLSGSTLPNLFDTHPPFQIDGNFGGISGVSEMLLQSQQDELFLLPALPQNWNKGEVKGFRARGGFIVDFKWSDNKIQSGYIYSLTDNKCVIRSKNPLKIVGCNSKKTNDNGYYTYSFNTRKGGKYKIYSKL